MHVKIFAISNSLLILTKGSCRVLLYSYGYGSPVTKLVKFVSRMNWERFSYDYHLDLTADTLLRHVITIEAYKEAALNLVLPPEWRTQLDRLNRVRAVYGTTALEGNPLSEAEVSHQMDLLDQLGGTH